MSNLRRIARGQSCQIRIPGICNGNPETTVFAHVRLLGISGIGLKSPDLFGCPACADCHSFVDSHHDAETKQAFYEGVFRWQNTLVKNGTLTW